MAATTVASLITQVRDQLVEPTPLFWSDAELARLMNRGKNDLWRAILDLHQDHYFQINEADVVLRANKTEISGIPSDCFRIQLIEPLNTTTTGVGRFVMFIPRKFKDPEFVAARAQGVQSVGNGTCIVYYQIVGEGAPNAAPTIVIAPPLDADLRVRLVFNPALPAIDETSVNPVPGESDHALVCWTIAYARAKETDTRTPDAGWLMNYATEKANILLSLTPREEQENDVIDDVFQGFGSL